jgi:hypothetical protein
MTYILIMTLTYFGHATSILSIKFEHKDSCEKAKKEYIKMMDGLDTNPRAICVDNY